METTVLSSSADNYLQSRLAPRWGGKFQKRAAYMILFPVDSPQKEQAVFTPIGDGGAR